MSIIDDYKLITQLITEAESDNGSVSNELEDLRIKASSLKELLYERYRIVLSTLCGYLGLINRYADLYEKGTTPDNQVFTELSIRLAGLKDDLLELKNTLHLPGELSFLEDNCFDGFEIKDGRFVGDKKNVKLILRKWMEGFPASANTYQYEVSVFVYFMAFPECFDSAAELVPETVAAAVRFSPLKIFGRRFLLWLKTFHTKFAS